MTGRDHNPRGFSAVLTGGGVKKGTVYGKTDEFGFKAIENPLHVHDLHATMLHLLGFDHEKLTYRYAGRDFRLTDRPRPGRARRVGLNQRRAERTAPTTESTTHTRPRNISANASQFGR